MAQRRKNAAKAAGLVLSLSLHLALVAFLVLAPARDLTPKRSSIVLTLLPPPPGFSVSNAPSGPSRAIARSTLSPSTPPIPSLIPAPLRPADPAPPPSPPGPTALTAPVPGTTPSASNEEARPTPQVTLKAPDDRLVSALRQSFGCSSSQRKNLTASERAECDRKGAARAATLPERTANPPYEKEYFDQVVAVWASPSHIPGTDCIHTVRAVTPKAPTPNLPDGKTTIAINPLAPIVCVSERGPPPKGPDHPSLKDLGLAH